MTGSRVARDRLGTVPPGSEGVALSCSGAGTLASGLVVLNGEGRLEAEGGVGFSVGALVGVVAINEGTALSAVAAAFGAPAPIAASRGGGAEGVCHRTHVPGNSRAKTSSAVRNPNLTDHLALRGRRGQTWTTRF